MRSRTAMPLLQVAEFLKIDPYVFAGIGDPNNKCDCIPQYTWQAAAYQKNQFWARDNFEEAVGIAENIFLQEMNEYPYPKYIEEKISIDSKNLNNIWTGKRKSIIPRFRKNPIFGIKTLTFVGVYALDKSDLNNITLSFTVPVGTTKDQVRFFYTSDDLDYEGEVHPQIEDFHLEIRPVTNIVISGTTCNVVIPAYLLKDPVFDEETGCQPNESGTYVDNVFVYIEELSTTDAGIFVGSSVQNCLDGDCLQTELSFCVTPRVVGDTQVFVPSWLNNVNYYDFHADSGRIYYTSGYNMKNRRFQKKISDIIMYLAVCFMTLGNECGCNYTYAAEHVKYLKSLEKIKILEAKNSIGDQYETISTSKQKEYISGYQPYNGILAAFRMMRTLNE